MGSNPTATALTCDDARFPIHWGAGIVWLESQFSSQFRPRSAPPVVHHRSPSSAEVQNSSETGEEHAANLCSFTYVTVRATQLQVRDAQAPGRCAEPVLACRDAGSDRHPSG